MCLRLADQTAYFAAHFSRVWWESYIIPNNHLAYFAAQVLLGIYTKCLLPSCAGGASQLSNPTLLWKWHHRKGHHLSKRDLAFFPAILWLQTHTLLVSCSKPHHYFICCWFWLLNLCIICWSSCMWHRMSFPFFFLDDSYLSLTLNVVLHGAELLCWFSPTFLSTDIRILIVLLSPRYFK